MKTTLKETTRKEHIPFHCCYIFKQFHISNTQEISKNRTKASIYSLPRDSIQPSPKSPLALSAMAWDMPLATLPRFPQSFFAFHDLCHFELHKLVILHIILELEYVSYFLKTQPRSLCLGQEYCRRDAVSFPSHLIHGAHYVTLSH